MTEQPSTGRVIQVGQKIVGAETGPALKKVQPRRLEDYPRLPAAYRALAQKYSNPLLMGPPISDELMAFLVHLYTEEEAGAVQHLGVFRGRTAAQIARREHRSADDMLVILERLANEKRAITSSGEGHEARFRLLPIMPGVFEMVLIAHSPETLTDWHRRFIELFEALYETGYSADYAGSPSLVRVLPVGRAIEGHPLALPSDHLAAVMDRFETFGVGQCQCRTTQRALGRGCDRDLGNCMVMGRWAEQGIRDGWLRAVSKQEGLEIKRKAEADGMVNWIMNVESTKGQCSCSCCGCCCHAMRIMIDFNAPSLFAPPHFLPKLAADRCTYCGKCVKKCPMNALAVDAKAKTWQHRLERCVGCGLCAVACESHRAISLEPVPAHKLPYRSWFAALAGSAPGILRTAWRVWRSR